MAFSYFFRDSQTLEAIRDFVIPHLRDRRFIRIWDAGCARGAEPYTLAMLLRDSMGYMVFRNVYIHATDIDEMDRYGHQINSGIYPQSDLDRVPQDVIHRHFESIGYRGYKIKDEIRNRLQFERHDLLSYEPPRMDFSLIVCKNVLLHFDPSAQVKILHMFHKALVNGGYLATEQSQKLPEAVSHLFEPAMSHAKIYRKVTIPATSRTSLVLKTKSVSNEKSKIDTRTAAQQDMICRISGMVNQ
ncbi:MAG: CheR family methyltransferase [Candidatus Zixiibacteriota bacterium]